MHHGFISANPGQYNFITNALKNRRKKMSYVIVLIFIIGTLFPISGYENGSAWWTHFTYMFTHADIWHLIVNSVAFFTLFKMLEAIYSKWFILAWSVSMAFIMSFPASYDIVTVGSSGMSYTLLGMFSALVLIGKVKFKSESYLTVYTVGVIAGFLVSFIMGTTNVLLHMLCFLGGLFVPVTRNLFNESK